jgi:co-chaperonin GroES (HSP10)
MSENRGGDVLARGEHSAQFRGAGANLSEFEYDLAMNADQVSTKYGLSVREIEEYQERRANGERLKLSPVGGDTLESLVPALESRWKAKPVEVKPKKFAEISYEEPTTILDRILVKRIPEDTEKFEILEDGSLRDKGTGFVIPYAYRQHNNIGIVLAVGQFVVLGGVSIPMSAIVHVGDRVTFGDYNSEVFKMNDEKTQAMCDAVRMNYEADPEGLRVVRVQDVRVVERPKVVTNVE